MHRIVKDCVKVKVNSFLAPSLIHVFIDVPPMIILFCSLKYWKIDKHLPLTIHSLWSDFGTQLQCRLTG